MRPGQQPLAHLQDELILCRFQVEQAALNDVVSLAGSKHTEASSVGAHLFTFMEAGACWRSPIGDLIHPQQYSAAVARTIERHDNRHGSVGDCQRRVRPTLRLLDRDQ